MLPAPLEIMCHHSSSQHNNSHPNSNSNNNSRIRVVLRLPWQLLHTMQIRTMLRNRSNRILRQIRNNECHRRQQPIITPTMMPHSTVRPQCTWPNKTISQITDKIGQASRKAATQKCNGQSHSQNLNNCTTAKCARSAVPVHKPIANIWKVRSISVARLVWKCHRLPWPPVKIVAIICIASFAGKTHSITS